MLLSMLTACLGLNVNAVPTQDLYADDGEVRKDPEAVRFAVVGNMRPAVPTDASKSRVATPATEGFVVKDISDAVQREEIDFVVLLGNLVAASTTAEWKGFSRDWGMLLSGSELPQTGTVRTRTLPVAGSGDRGGDERLTGFGAAFPGVGADIGYNRVASWYFVDVQAKGATWRIVVLDSDKPALGSRWEEQMAWVPKVSADHDAYDAMLVFMNDPIYTLSKGVQADPGGAASELLGQLEDGAEIGSIKAVFAGNAGTSEVYLPSGKFGELYVVAGGGGAPADSLPRWGALAERDLKLEPIFDLALMREFDRYAAATGAPEAAKEKAHASGSFEGFTAEFDARYFPVQGWWSVTLEGTGAALSFRIVSADGTLKDVYTIQYSEKVGWKAGK